MNSNGSTVAYLPFRFPRVNLQQSKYIRKKIQKNSAKILIKFLIDMIMIDSIFIKNDVDRYKKVDLAINFWDTVSVVGMDK